MYRTGFFLILKNNKSCVLSLTKSDACIFGLKLSKFKVGKVLFLFVPDHTKLKKPKMYILHRQQIHFSSFTGLCE